MKTIKLLIAWAVICGLHLVSGYAQTATVPDWENVSLVGLGKEPAHASMIACPDVSTAKSIRWVANEERAKSPWYVSLNGTWKFHYGQTRRDRVPEFFLPNFEDHDWSPVKVPATLEMQGFGTPIYVNLIYPWNSPKPPLIPDDNSYNTMGSYRRSFTVPKNWTGRPVFITFDGVYSFFYLWVNGQKVGLSKDSRSPAEFEITQYLRPGRKHFSS